MTLTTILHPTDFSRSAGQALELAARLAARQGASLHILHGVTLHANDDGTQAAELEKLAESARSIIGATDGAAPVEVTTSERRAVFAFDAIMQATIERQPDLVVMGTHGRGGFSKLLMGSNAEKMLRHAPCSILTVKEGARVPSEGRFRRLLVPVDFSDWAGRALDTARVLRDPDGSDITLLHVVEPVPPMYYAGNVSSRFELDPELRSQLEEHLQTWSGGLERASAMITEGSPPLEIARVADETDIDLIVMSTKGLTGVEHLLVGSVTERVCRFATVPVLTVR